MSLSSNVDDLATRVATEINAVRSLAETAARPVDLTITTDTSGSNVTPVEKTVIEHTLASTSPDLYHVELDDGRVPFSQNEWGAIRAKPTAYTGYLDAAIRLIIDSGFVDPTFDKEDLAIDMTDRRLSGDAAQTYGRHWITGDAYRKGLKMSDCHVVANGTSDSAINALGLPDGTIVVELDA